jgi:hypothetical protein
MKKTKMKPMKTKPAPIKTKSSPMKMTIMYFFDRRFVACREGVRTEPDAASRRPWRTTFST